jgi:hypothetical protein
MKSHTKLPWKVTHSFAPDWEGDWYIHSGRKLICMGEGWSNEEQANVRLIVSAPKLFELLDEIVHIMSNWSTVDKDYLDGFMIDGRMWLSSAKEIITRVTNA